MSVFTVKMKTHIREEITGLGNLNLCKVHDIKPKIFKMVVGKRKETFYVANCQHDDCGKIAHTLDEVINFWNKHN